MIYSNDELLKIKKVLVVFADFIASTKHTDIAHSEKAGYLLVTLDDSNLSHAVEVDEIESAEDLCDRLLYELANDVIEESNTGWSELYNCSPVLRKEIRKQAQKYMRLLPEYSYLIDKQFEDPHMR